MKKVYLLLGVTLLLLLLALLAFAFGAQLELWGVPPDIQALYLKGTQAKWRMMAGLLALVAGLIALLAGILWLNVRREK